MTSSEEGKRQTYIHELMNTEETYMEDMSVVMDVSTHYEIILVTPEPCCIRPALQSGSTLLCNGMQGFFLQFWEGALGPFRVGK